MENKPLSPFEILSVASNLRYCKLKLPDSWMIHSVFNIELLKRYKGRDPKNQVIEVTADGRDWDMESIFASEPSEENTRTQVYLVKWMDYSHEENTWETYGNGPESDLRLLKEYYRNNPKWRKMEGLKR